MMNPQDLENLDSGLLKSILEPLLDDFCHWFGKTIARLEDRPVSGLSPEQQAEMLQTVKESLQQVNAAQALFQATDGQVGVDLKVVMKWHRLVTQCWQVIVRSSRSET